MKNNQDHVENLKILIAGVAALTAAPAAPMAPLGNSPLRNQAALLLEGDLLAFRRAAGLDTAWPHERAGIALDAQRQMNAHKEQRAKRGREAWQILHGRALQYLPENRNAEFDFLSIQFPKLIPGCTVCRDDYADYLTKNPPDLGSADSYFAWTVQLHNHVNAKPELNKPSVSLDAARSIWA